MLLYVCCATILPLIWEVLMHWHWLIHTSNCPRHFSQSNSFHTTLTTQIHRILPIYCISISIRVASTDRARGGGNFYRWCGCVSSGTRCFEVSPARTTQIGRLLHKVVMCEILLIEVAQIGWMSFCREPFTDVRMSSAMFQCTNLQYKIIRHLLHLSGM